MQLRKRLIPRIFYKEANIDRVVEFGDRKSQRECTQCGQLLYRIDKDRSIPLSIPGLVERGHCLRCEDSLTQSPISSLERSVATDDSDDPFELFPYPLSRLPSMQLHTILPTKGLPNIQEAVRRNEDLVCVKTLNESSEKYKHPHRAVTCRPHGFDKKSSTHKSTPLPPYITVDGLPDPAYATAPTRSASSNLKPIQQRVKNLQMREGTVFYTGTYNARGEKQGLGQMIWSNGDVYEGSFVCDARHGHGKLTFASTRPHRRPDNGEYVGDWSDNKMHGRGHRRYSSGDFYAGEYRYGERHGRGCFCYANGDLYDGSFFHNEIHGPGQYCYAKGQCFQGFFRNGKREGKGRLHRTDGTMEIFQYINDQRVGQGVLWSADRRQAWRLWAPTGVKPNSGLQKESISIADALSRVQEIENVSDSATKKTPGLP